MSFSCPCKSRLVDIDSRNQFAFDFSSYKYNFLIDFVIHKIDNNYLVNSTLHALKKGKGISRNRCPLISSPLKFLTDWLKQKRVLWRVIMKNSLPRLEVVS